MRRMRLSGVGRLEGRGLKCSGFGQQAPYYVLFPIIMAKCAIGVYRLAQPL